MASQEHYRIVEELRRVPPRPDATIDELRQGFEAFATNRFTVPPGVRFEPVDAGGVAAEWNVPDKASSRRFIFYIHGGGHSMGSIQTHRGLVARLALAAEAQALSIGYRLAPEHRYPAAVDDCITAYRWLLAQGMAPEDMVLAGDSAGAGLVLSTMQALRDAGDRLPAAAVCMSPVTDLAKEGESMRTRAALDPWVSAKSSKANADRYLGARDPHTPGASPLYADQRGLPPTLVLVGTSEVLHDDSTRWVERARGAGVDVDLEVWDEMIHVWPLFGDELPEALRAIQRMGEYIRANVPAPGSA
jgi:epsilon-lactone hydrolase